jgi:hypothetical protein
VTTVHVPGERLSSEICSIAPDGSALLRLTGDAYGSERPRWSPDGSRIVYYVLDTLHPGTGSANLSGIYVMDRDGTGQTRIADAGAQTPSPGVSSMEWPTFGRFAWPTSSRRVAAQHP